MAAVAVQCGVELHSSLTLALPRTVKVTLAFSVPTVKVTRALLSAPQRWEDDGNPPTLSHSGHGVRYVATPWWLPPTLPRTRIRSGVQLRGANREQQ